MDLDLSKAAEAVAHALLDSEYETGTYDEEAGHATARAALPLILEALIAKADADHDTAHDMSGHRATRAFWASEWLNDLAEDMRA